MAFNACDSVLSFTSRDGYMQRFDMIAFKKRNDADKKLHLEYKSACFLDDPRDDAMFVTIG